MVVECPKGADGDDDDDDDDDANADARRSKGESALLLPLWARNAANAAEAASRATRTFNAPSIAKLLRMAVCARSRALAR